ncbi:hypothetical protein STEG23_032466 [Scotinomys teguina]
MLGRGRLRRSQQPDTEEARCKDTGQPERVINQQLALITFACILLEGGMLIEKIGVFILNSVPPGTGPRCPVQMIEGKPPLVEKRNSIMRCRHLAWNSVFPETRMGAEQDTFWVRHQVRHTWLLPPSALKAQL